jgi:hypothetical protein
MPKRKFLVFYFGSNEEYFFAIDRMKNLGIESVEQKIHILKFV